MGVRKKERKGGGGGERVKNKKKGIVKGRHKKIRRSTCRS